MSTFRLIAGREIRLALRSRSLILTALIFAAWFPVFSGLWLATAAGGDATAVAGAVATITLPIGIFMGYIFCSDAFFREKRDGTIETLLCAPISLRRLWEGKAAGVTVPAYLATLLSAVVTVAAVSTLVNAPVVVEPLLLLHLAVVVPIWIAAAAGLIGAAQLALGMRENQILGIVFMLGFFVLIGGLQGILSGGAGISATMEALLALVGFALLALARVIAGKVTKERIVRTIP